MFLTQAKKDQAHGFTLIELLIVIAIILILAAALLFAINPAALLRRSRDSQRVSDLNTVATSISVFLADSRTMEAATDDTWFTIPAADDTACEADTTLIAFDTGATDDKNCPTTVAAAAKNDLSVGSWIRANFTLVTSGAPIASLPIDPTNTSTAATATNASDALYYRFCNDGDVDEYIIDATLEDASNAAKETTDGGSSNFRYEIGNDLTACGTNTFTAD